MRFCSQFGVAAIAVAITSLAVNDGAVFAADYGTVTGQFVLQGEIPILAPLVMEGDANVKDAAVCAKQTIPDEKLVVDKASKGIANVFVYMPKPPANIHPDLIASKEPEISFDQKGCRFIPHTLILRTDQTIKILNGDPITHNTHVTPILNSGQNQAIGPDDRVGNTKWKFTQRERIPTSVNCDIHRWMTAYWLIIDHPYAAITDKEGKFKIEKVPVGEQEFIAWQEGTGWAFGKPRDKRTRKVVVKANATADLGVIKIPAADFAK